MCPGCVLKAASLGDLSRAANLYQAALAAALSAKTRRDIEAILASCLDALSRTAQNGSSRRRGKVPAGK
jgi:lambda repressor-like predicted transcriptional regulator